MLSANRQVEPLVVGLEGLPFTGKSTSAQRIAATLSNTLVVSDYHEVRAADGADVVRLAGMPTDSRDQAHRVRDYRAADIARWDEVADATAKLVILDRTPISIAAYNTAVCHLLGFYSQAEAVTVDDWAVETVNAYCDAVVFLDVSEGVAVARHEALSVAIDPRMRRRDFLAPLLVRYEALLGSLTRPVVRVSSEQSLDAVALNLQSVVKDLL